MTDEILDENLREGQLRLPYKLNFVKSPFKVWKITFFLSLALGVLGSLVLLYMEFVYYPNNNPYDYSSGIDYWDFRETAEYQSFWATYSMFQYIAVGMYVIGGLAMIVNFIMHLVVLYRHWAVIQKIDSPSATPGSAVGFLFIPAFNLYWIFIAFYKLSVDQQRFVKRYGINVRKQPAPGLALAAVICRLVPYVGLLTFFILGPIRIFNQQKVAEDIITQLGE